MLLTQLDSKLWHDKLDDIDGTISMKIEALEGDLFEQSVWLKKWVSGTGLSTAASLSLGLSWIPLGATISGQSNGIVCNVRIY